MTLGGPRHVDWKTIPGRTQVLSPGRQEAAKPNRPVFKCGLYHGLLCDGGKLCASVFPPVLGDFDVYLPVLL